jgi:hypothetical protein
MREAITHFRVSSYLHYRWPSRFEHGRTWGCSVHSAALPSMSVKAWHLGHPDLNIQRLAQSRAALFRQPYGAAACNAHQPSALKQRECERRTQRPGQMIMSLTPIEAGLREAAAIASGPDFMPLADAVTYRPSANARIPLWKEATR